MKGGDGLFWGILFAAISMIAFVLFRCYKNTEQVELRRVEVKEQRHFRTLHVLQLSDLHLENISISPEGIYDRLKNESIDLIALTGDFLDRKKTLPKLERYLQALVALNPKYGIYAVFGNHDYVLKGQDLQKLKNIFTRYDVRLLFNEHETVQMGSERLHIIGIDDFCTGKSEIKKAFHGLIEGYRLVLTHDPNVVLHMDGYHFDYLLSGHFHGGQIHWPRPYHLVKMGKLVRMNMVKGLHKVNGRPFYISEGLGQTGLNIRAGSRPEMTLHRIFVPRAVKKRLPLARAEA